MKHLLLLACTLATLSLVGCKSGKKEPGLEMASSSAVCKKAMSCCEAYAKDGKDTVSPEDLNLKCSGVALAKTDGECDLFRQGYADSLTAKGTALPAECNK